MSDVINHPATLRERFFAIGWSETEGGCWEWNGSRHVRGGYGQIAGTRVSGPLKAHRVAHEIWIGAIPVGKHVMHSCDNPPCVNPAHLSAGSNGDNMRDKLQKGRGAHMVMTGEAAPASKLTEEQVEFIRTSPDTGAALASRFSVSRTTISKIKRGLTWVSGTTKRIERISA